MQLLDGEFNNTIILPDDPNYKYFSLVPFDASVSGVTITGAKYSLDNASINRSSTLCISNEVSRRQAHITVRKGKVLLIRSGE